MKLKPEYSKLFEIYPDLKSEINKLQANSWGFIEVRNNITLYYDKVWIAPEILYAEHKYKTKDPLVKKLCEEPDFNKAFQTACEEQWDDDDIYIIVQYCIGTYNKYDEYANVIRVYKSDITQELI